MSGEPDSAGARGLSEVSQRELRDLVRAIDAGWLSFPCSELGLRQAGLEVRHLHHVTEILRPCGPQTARMLIEIAIAERTHRPPPRLELVWTGPETQESMARDTGIVVRQLFERAKRSVIIGGFRFDQGSILFGTLHQRMRSGLDVTMFVDIEGHADTVAGGSAYAQTAIDALLRENWPFGAPFPVVYYDPRSAIPGPPWVSLHAKCIVVDDQMAFVTSANFTDRGQTRNIEVGVCIEDRVFAEQLASQWRGLVSRALVVRYR